MANRQTHFLGKNICYRFFFVSSLFFSSSSSGDRFFFSFSFSFFLFLSLSLSFSFSFSFILSPSTPLTQEKKRNTTKNKQTVSFFSLFFLSFSSTCFFLLACKHFSSFSPFFPPLYSGTCPFFNFWLSFLL